MIDYKEHLLPNGLKLIVHEDHLSPVVCLNILYKVGSRNENPDKTGFAHLFEHLMFGGSKNIGNFDSPLQNVGGDNNAFTSPDITNYYITIPSINVETAFWLESDRMLSLSFDPKVLEVQRKVVIEEFKQRYLNQTYGDLWLKLRPLAYKVHPYQWPTIGKEISHIENATMDDVKAFFDQFYDPSNAILVVAGDITEAKALALTEKWFGPIPSTKKVNGHIPVEPSQNEARFLEIRSDVPAAAIYKAYHMPGRVGKAYHATDLFGDILGRGKSSFLHQRFVNDLQWMSSISAYATGSVDPGLLTISGKINEGVDIEKVDKEIEDVLHQILSGTIDEKELEKTKNQAESAIVFGETEVLNRAMGLAYASFLGNTGLVNDELAIVQSVTKEDVLDAGKQVMKSTNCSTVYYIPKN
ncbi:MAG: zinc protease [Cyclobacteriaceae bacterium]|jgi:zinc protease